jgi:hypothetical protein
VEHLILLLVALGRWIDRRFQKPLRLAVPDLDRLLRDPRGTLAGQSITIGPARRYGSAIFLALAAALLGGLLTLLCYALLVGAGNVPANRRRELVPFFWLAVSFVLWLSVWLVLRRLRGGSMVLSAAGVELHHRRSVVCCPWALFNAAGQPFHPRPDRMLLPVVPAAIPAVELREDEAVRATGERVKARQLRFKSGTEAVLQPLYEVPLGELGFLLLQLGHALGGDLPAGAAGPRASPMGEAVLGPAAKIGRDGWITVRLTRLAFPPFCCDCGAPTNQVQEFYGHTRLLRLGRFLNIEGGEFAACWIPVCESCQGENRRRYRRAILRGIGLGVGLPFVGSAALALALQEAVFLLAFIPVEVIGGLIGLAIGGTVGKRKTPPVHLERYQPAQGTIAIRFRWPEYGERLVAFLQTREGTGERAALGTTFPA